MLVKMAGLSSILGKAKSLLGVGKKQALKPVIRIPQAQIDHEIKIAARIKRDVGRHEAGFTNVKKWSYGEDPESDAIAMKMIVPGREHWNK